VPFKDEKSASPSPADSGNPLTANNTRFLRSEKMFSNDDEEINPEYRTILSKLLKNVKNEIDISVNRSSGEDDNAEKTPDRESFFDRSYFEDNRIRDRIKESDNDRSKENDLSFTRQNISDSDEDKAYLLDKSEVLLDEKQGEDYSLLPSSSAFRLGSFVAIQRTMASQGFTLKPYSPDNSPPKQFLLLNRINMVAALLLFLVAAIQTAAIYYFWEPIIGIGLKYYVYILTAMLIVPIVSSLVYLFNPYKRTKKRYNVFYSIISSIMMFIVCFLGILSIALLFKIDVNNQYEMILKLYIPTIYASNFVFYSVIWAILYKTGSCRY